jgi:hypothetical protein
MGAEIFEDVGVGKTIHDAFLSVKENALHECGHRGYTGTIAEKGSYTLFDRPKNLTVDQILEGGLCGWLEYEDPAMKDNKSFLEKVFKVADDKWGNAACIELTAEEHTITNLPEDAKVFLFFGNAAS